MPKIAHLADVHWRGLSRHQEYRDIFEKVFQKMRALGPDIIYIGGDIVHSKTQGISPELIDSLVWWFTEMSQIAPVHVILGNHDGILLNKDRQDTITPIIKALDSPNIYLYKKSGVYPTGFDGFNWCVFSCFDEKNWKNVKPSSDSVDIALFHGGVWGSLTDIDWKIEGDVEVSFFDDYDFALLGDIHRVQYLNDEKTIAYCGSTIQQNYGEDTNKGFLFWDIRGKDDFDVQFHRIDGTQPFITVDWAGNVSKTLEKVKDHPEGARYRIRTKEAIPSVEWKHLCNELEILKGPTEVVSKDEHQVDTQIISTETVSLFKNDLKDPDVLVNLIQEYFGEADLSKKDWRDLERLTRRYFKSISRSGKLTPNNKWSLKSLEFDNTFSYGKGNSIDFESLTGITGIFGRNARGKSSIVGTLMYCLYNTTDRGSIKNLHVINTRKGHCLAKATVGIGGDLVRIERQSVKNTDRRGNESALTSLNIFKVDEAGNEIEDLSREQRRVTEKALRELIGTSDDFLLTSLASQGEMNAFIKQRNTARKYVLTRFLGLDIFERMSSLAKDESKVIQAQVKSAPDRDWDASIAESILEKQEVTEKIKTLENDLSEARLDKSKIQMRLNSFDNANVVTPSDVKRQEEIIDGAKNTIESLKKNLGDLINEQKEIQEKIDKIKKVKEKTSIEDLRERLDSQRDLETSLIEIKHSHERELTLLKAQKRSASKLSEVPCGDQFPMCKFIKDSHKDKQRIEDQEEKVEILLDQLNSAQLSLDRIKKENLPEKIQKYEALIKLESELKIKQTKKGSEIRNAKSDIEGFKRKILRSTDDLNDLKSRMIDSDVDAELESLKAQLYDLQQKITSLDAERLSSASRLGRVENALETFHKEKKKFQALKQKWRIFDLFTQAVSKRGVPLQIIMSQLPVINAEISKILQSVVSFTIELEADPNSNAMDVYINYGDSRRIIEVASGMEKMIASLAIRVALINVSSLSKPDVLIIDEGFGSLDDVNVEACNRLLTSLKKWFKSILIISHVDGVKDVVDNVIDITRNGKDAKVVYV